MSTESRLPAAADFPAHTEFVIYEFDMPLANVPGGVGLAGGVA